MTLRKQLFAALSLLFLAVLSGLLWVNLSGTRGYLENQLATHAQEAATSLSMRLSQVMVRNDPVLTEMQVDAMFDRGYFQRVVVLDPAGAVLLEKSLPLKVGDVPVWLTSAFALQPPGGEAFISSGWKQLGKVVVESQPTHAYEYLWSNAKELVGWVAVVYAVALALTHALLKVILNPLLAIERTARAIQDKQFEQIAQRPRARELARVVRAMNDMSRRIAEILDLEVKKAETYRQQLMLDEVTQVDNRKSFDIRFAELLGNPDTSFHGFIFGVEVNNLKGFNTDNSYRRGDELLRNMASCLRDSDAGEATLVARLGGGSFAVVWVSGDQASARIRAQALCDQLSALFVAKEMEAMASFSAGLVAFDGEQRKGDIMARLDVAIETARLRGRNELETSFGTGDTVDLLGSQGWRDLLEQSIQDKRWSLLGQLVMKFSNRQVVHIEVMGRLVDQRGEAIPASRFIPMATRHRLMSDVDRAILTMVKQELVARRDLPVLAVNVSAQSVADPVFMQWLQQYLRDLGAHVHRLSLELTCYGCSQNLPAARGFAQLVRRTGAKFGIDRLGMDASAPQVLREVPPDYVKLDSMLIVKEVGAEQAKDWMESIMALARSLDAMVIAQGIETQEDFTMLSSTHQAGQGYFIARPTPL